MTQRQTNTRFKAAPQAKIAQSYYALLELHPAASSIAIRRSYRQLSKKYHPDTTKLPLDVAKAKFQQLSEAYATLSNPQRRSLYDLEIGYSRLNVIQAPNWDAPSESNSSAYLDPTDRPLSAGEVFVLVLLGLTFMVCLLLVMAIAYWRQ